MCTITYLATKLTKSNKHYYCKAVFGQLFSYRNAQGKPEQYKYKAGLTDKPTEDGSCDYAQLNQAFQAYFQQRTGQTFTPGMYFSGMNNQQVQQAVLGEQPLKPNRPHQTHYSAGHAYPGSVLANERLQKGVHAWYLKTYVNCSQQGAYAQAPQGYGQHPQQGYGQHPQQGAYAQAPQGYGQQPPSTRSGLGNAMRGLFGRK